MTEPLGEQPPAKTAAMGTNSNDLGHLIGRKGYRRIQESDSAPCTVSPVNTTYAKAALIGGAAGVMAGLFGVGGGIIVVPGLVLWLAVSQRQASGTSIATIIASSSAALIAFGISGSVDWGAALLVFTGAAVGAVIGARAATLLPERMLSAAFATVLLIAGVRMML